MFNSKNNKETIMTNNNQAQNFATLVGPGTSIKGDLTFSGMMIVEGSVEGSIVSSSDDDTLNLGESGSISGTVKAGNLTISGTVEGDITASGKIEVTSHARINGNIYYVNIEMETGSQVNGKLIYQGGDVTPMIGKKSDKSEKNGK